MGNRVKKNMQMRQTGFAMLEVLASVLILAFCLLSIASLLLFTQKSNSSSYIKQQAVQSGYDIIDLMRANRAAAIAGNYAMSNLGGAAPAAPGTNCQSVVCTPAAMAAWDLYIWQTRLAQYGGSGQVVMAAPTGIAGLPAQYTGEIATVTVQWNDAPAQHLLGGSTNLATATGGTANLAQIVLKSQL
jgi:type IV pilus assembly protein PilV